MGTHLGNFLKSRREERGWSLGEAARRLGYSNVGKGSRRVHLLEQGDAAFPDILAKLVLLYGLDPPHVEELIAQDRAEFVAAWEWWVDEPVPVQIVVRCILGVYGTQPVPPGLNEDELIEHCRGLARRLRKRVFLVLSRRVTLNVNEEGEVTSRNVATPDCDPRPSMRLGNKRFVLPFTPADPLPARQ